MSKKRRGFPAPDPDDLPEVQRALVSARRRYNRAFYDEAVRWVRNAAEAASDGGALKRAQELIREVARLELLFEERRARRKPGGAQQPPPVSDLDWDVLDGDSGHGDGDSGDGDGGDGDDNAETARQHAAKEKPKAKTDAKAKTGTKAKAGAKAKAGTKAKATAKAAKPVSQKAPATKASPQAPRQATDTKSPAQRPAPTGIGGARNASLRKTLESAQPRALASRPAPHPSAQPPRRPSGAAPHPSAQPPRRPSGAAPQPHTPQQPARPQPPRRSMKGTVMGYKPGFPARGSEPVAAGPQPASPPPPPSPPGPRQHAAPEPPPPPWETGPHQAILAPEPPPPPWETGPHQAIRAPEPPPPAFGPYDRQHDDGMPDFQASLGIAENAAQRRGRTTELDFTPRAPEPESEDTVTLKPPPSFGTSSWPARVALVAGPRGTHPMVMLVPEGVPLPPGAALLMLMPCSAKDAALAEGVFRGAPGGFRRK